MANELLEFPGGVLGLAFNLDEDEIGCIILGESSQIEEGDLVKQTGRILSIPVGDGFLGRVIDPLGVPLDGKGPIPRRTRGCSRSRPPTSSTVSR
jgi:F-type H+-transporting ATPase subunit alpha